MALHEAGAAAHKLKGAAANLGMPALASAAAHLELAARDGQIEPRHWAALRSALDAALVSIDRYVGAMHMGAMPMGATSEAAPAAYTANLERLSGLLNQAIAALAEDRPDALEPLLMELRTVLPADDVQPLQEAVDDFDFRLAEAIVRALQAAHHL